MEPVRPGEGVQFECPFCKRNVIATQEPPQVFHVTPWCEKFKTLPLTEYIEAVSRSQRN